MKRFMVYGLCAMSVATAFSDETERGRWSFSVGPSWRSRTKMRVSGGATDIPSIGVSDTSATYDYDSDVKEKAPDPDHPEDGELWKIRAIRTEVTRSPGNASVSISEMDEESAMGLNVASAYDVYADETFSIGLGLRFAAFFNMRSAASRFLNTGSTRTVVSKGWSLCPSPPYPPSELTPTPPSTPAEQERYFQGDSIISDTTIYGSGSRLVRARFTSDLYQVTVGPRITWHPNRWLDVYAGAEAMANLAAADFRANGESSSDVACLLGFGGHAGFVVNLTENVGIFGQAGYEWADESDVHAGGFKADVDFSSIVIAAGLQVRF